MTLVIPFLLVGLLAQAQPVTPPDAPLRAGLVVAEPQRSKLVKARYPKDARRAGLAGNVVIDCVIDARGRVTETTVLEGVPPLTEAALEAVRQWRYEPTLVNGSPVPVVMEVTLSFKLPELKYYGLLGSLDSENEHLRESAARWLGHLRPGDGVSEGNVRKAIEALEPLAEADESASVRATAARALSRLDGRPLPAEVTAADPDDAPTVRPLAWGTLIDPLRQSDAREVDDGILIRVPAGLYDLSVEIDQTAAPRVLRPVRGDFVAEVDVGKVSEALGRRRGSRGLRGFHGAGLLLWVDGQNYVRLESATYGGEIDPALPRALPPFSVRYALFEQRADGELVRGRDPAQFGLADAPTSLRLERRGKELRAFARQHEEDWREVGRMEVALPVAAHIGVAAVNTATSPLVATFRGFRLSGVE